MHSEASLLENENRKPREVGKSSIIWLTQRVITCEAAPLGKTCM